MLSNINLHFIHSFIQKLFIEHLLCAGHYSSVGNMATDKNRSFHGIHILLVRDKHSKEKQ